MGTSIKSYNDSLLWGLFLKKAKDNHKLIDKLTEFCDAAEDLSRRIVLSFPDFTIHDGKHIGGVCDWIYKLLQGQYRYVSLGEVVLLLMSACCHDLGMAIENGEEIELINEWKTQSDAEWKRYFLRHPEDSSCINDSKEQTRVLRDYVRETHHLRAAKKIQNLPWDNIFLSEFGISKELVSLICRSHGENLTHINYEECVLDDVDPSFCAILLRLGDAMDYDANRAPKILFNFLGLDETIDAARKKSRMEWLKNFSGTFHRPKNNKTTISYRAEDIPEPVLLNELDKYVSWVGEELTICRRYLDDNSPRWKSHDPLPYYLNKIIKGKGFKSANIRFRMDQKKVLELLSGTNLYDTPGVFVRELLQNAIDAIHARCDLDPSFSLNNAQITIDVWSEGLYYWFQIKDNGIGMDERIINNYLLNIGRSYYSDENGFKKDLAQQGKQIGYSAISRFGIGILSCFMGGDNDNVVEISTRHYGQDAHPIRLSIPGLDGLYFLSELSSKERGEPMPSHSKANRDEYLRDVGTTVCVRTNILGLADSSFLDLLNNYICFPDVKISYTGPEGHKEYMTHNDLLDFLDGLVIDFEENGPKIYSYTLPSDEFVRIKNLFPEADWSGIHLPSLKVCYWPVGKMCDSDKLAGIMITYYPDWQNIHCKHSSAIMPFKSDLSFGFAYKGNAEYMLAFKNDKNYFPINSNDDYESLADNELAELRSSFLSFEHKVADYQYRIMLDGEEKHAHILAETGSIELPTVAYNGILAGYINDYPYDRHPHSFGVVLLSDNYRPYVSLSRNEILTVPFELSCDIAIQWQRMNLKYPMYEHHAVKYGTLQDFFQLLNDHPKWLKYLQNDVISFKCRENPFDILKLAYSKISGCSFCQEYDRRYGNLQFVKSSSSNNPDCYKEEMPFPVTLFMPIGDNLFGIQDRNVSCVYYSSSHPFVKWLIAQREKLQLNAPTVYARIITEMMNEESATIWKTLNNELLLLKKIPGDPFNVSKISEIKESEILLNLC